MKVVILDGKVDDVIRVMKEAGISSGANRIAGVDNIPQDIPAAPEQEALQPDAVELKPSHIVDSMTRDEIKAELTKQNVLFNKNAVTRTLSNVLKDIIDRKDEIDSAVKEAQEIEEPEPIVEGEVKEVEPSKDVAQEEVVDNPTVPTMEELRNQVMVFIGDNGAPKAEELLKSMGVEKISDLDDAGKIEFMNKIKENK